MKDLTSSFMLNNGLSIPCVGYGTFQTPNDETCAAVLEAIKVGYRHIDTAAFYGNEEGVGEAVRKSGVPREQLFITSKVWNSDRGYEKTKAAFAKTMKNLQMEYLDLLLIHWPANRKQFGDAAKGINAETWRAMEELYQEGKIKAIGLSNFLPHHIEELMETAQIKPMVNQIEFHPGWAQTDIVEYCLKNDIVVEAWSPLGRKDALENETLKSIAAKYGKSVAQLCIRWVLQHGVLPLPKSVTPSRILENTKVFDFTIDAADMQAIDALKNIGGQCALPDEVDF
ncbi:MAG: aldo/keto reductase [Clostridiales bacterium]|nr:aldo/keto reductase [Clostridiales bacterium]